MVLKMKKLLAIVVLGLLWSGNSILIAKEITNLTWYKSNYVGKQLPDFRETVTTPALGKEAWIAKSFFIFKTI